jgi:hypothetical protein
MAKEARHAPVARRRTASEGGGETVSPVVFWNRARACAAVLRSHLDEVHAKLNL